MSQTDSKPFFGWTIRGFGGVLNIMESYRRDGIEPAPNQLELLEYQTRRLMDLYEYFSSKSVRSKETILVT
ncbi:unnamed protein product, partial [marine sediment metagenome]